MACCLPIVAMGAGEAPATQGTVNAVQSLASDYAVHPKSEAEDIYKFLHQALYGPGHAISSLDAAALLLEQEVQEMGPLERAEPFCTVLGGDPILMRVNLRLFVAEGRDLERLLGAFAATAEAIHPDPAQMQLAVSLAVEFLQSVGSTQLADQLEQLEKELRPQGYPAVHHSQTYREAYEPAYRVVTASSANRLGWCSN